MSCTSPYRTASQLKKLKADMKAEKNKPDYEKGFEILMEYFDCIPEDERAEVDKRLRKCGL